ncbi:MULTISPECIES: SDR family NAD(P)-dependent oxidoreductase [unclassified Pseudomonas]|uniref:SDR family NAD(P)-dependent oxidoreductase n=1 Tax=unclassified Pseudomonas TaxID=196821 RepID=UPI000BC9FAE3|nr:MULTISPECIES: SDR family oxidoreductase [unclassified Pseudomonas]PVZ19667.1 NAD(P)-dependent dehydrogenase (short-subunit alcohol dehydrogenase family) [Pseudomonas sp. URIL14HWK12:I12]PVZ22748.1 NAD(P)-dependent dehydrogenase (short-subunit alcohol dehydrogenase family) [Pseudomonas sp. URIL14HWK12:I10]PVZ37622.1 NAD(P)-dependent dehydrogenase (short-subunit alcohol dehydrogenase family) [Pseudomonas sp. URIL14HWK12:I11]SNZ15270.1 NAD(P)-dependent dehydrogenase, short-chain alcohol dehydro
MDLGLKDRVALITGASGGIGLATAQLLAEEGVKLVLTDLEQGALESACTGLGSDVLMLAADMTRQAEVDALVQKAEARFGAVDIVVHTAGVTGAKGDPLELTDADYLEAWETDFFSAVRVARATIPAMRERGWGRLVCITSENAVQPYWEEAVYNVAKAGLGAFIKNLSYKEARHGVLCNTVAPAFIETGMTNGMMEKRAKDMGVSFEEAVKSFLEEERPGIVQQRRGQPEEVAAAIALLVSARASFINGSNLRVDGGSVQSVQN